jgi:hypothetical protein
MEISNRKNDERERLYLLHHFDVLMIMDASQMSNVMAFSNYQLRIRRGRILSPGKNLQIRILKRIAEMSS